MSTSNVAENSQGAELLQQRLNDPHVVQGLTRLLDRLDSIAFAMDAVEGLVARGDVIADSVADAVQEFKHVDGRWTRLFQQAPELLETGAKFAIASRGIDLEEVEKSHLLARLSDPQTLALINKLLDRLPIISLMAESMEELVKRSEVIAENVAGMVHDLKLGEVHFDIEKGKALLDQLGKWQEIGEQVLGSRIAGEDLPKAIEAGANLVDSGMLDPDVVATLGRVGRQAVESYLKVSSRPVQPIGGLWAMLRASKDPDVQKTVGFAVAFAKEFAQHLK